MGLTNCQYDAIMRIYEQRQLHNKDILFTRYEEVYRKIPELKKTDDAISSFGVAQARKLLSGDEYAVEEFREQQKRYRLYWQSKVPLFPESRNPASLYTVESSGDS